MWKHARLDCKKEFADKETKDVDELLSNQKARDLSGGDNVLTQALSQKDRSRIVRRVGKYVTKKKYFHTPTASKSKQSNEKKTVYVTT
ncbi:hypothetical protein Csa_017435 [Cucumis sativus]|uniref:Uncharacterized protein n=1 Tax=Cucumis sativus TaxID=3659 RepID=A0A0A0LDV4_CUCSA|nr:hypothetical protein Csa_017435 [Cucumis sativus]